jgi:micrococcal nuclease
MGCDSPGSTVILAEPVLYRVDAEDLATSAEADISRMLPAEVVRHIDGDTVVVRIAHPPPELQTQETIRMIGVDTPETVHPNKPTQPFGPEASAFTKEQLLGKQVYLAFDWDLRDRYGRLLAYLYIIEEIEKREEARVGTCFNTRLIREGYAYAYRYFAFQFMEEFTDLEQAAREAKRGLWGL